MATTGDLGPKHFYHGTRADLKAGDLIEPGPQPHSQEPDGKTTHVNLTTTLDAAAWEAETSPGDGPAMIYTVEPTGPVSDDPEFAPDRYPVNPDAALRSRNPLRVTGLCTDPQGRPLRFYHGTKADLKPGDLMAPGYSPNFGDLDRTTTYIYFSGTLDAATWGAELARGEGRGRIYIVEPTGPFEDDPNLTNMKFRGNPTKSYRSRDPLRVTGEVEEWKGHPTEAVKAMKGGIAELEKQGHGPIDD